MTAPFGENSESIYKTGINNFLNSFAFLFCEAFVALVFFRARKIVRRVSDIQVSAKLQVCLS